MAQLTTIRPESENGQLASVSLRSRLTIVMIVGAVLLAIAATLSALSFARLVSARHTILNQIDPASLQADQLLLAYVNQETGVRGYVLSANSAFLQPYESGLVQQRNASGQLSRDLSHQPELLALANLAEKQGSAWQRQYAQPAIASVATGSKAYTSQSGLLESKRLFNGIRTSFARLDSRLAATRASAGAQLNSATGLLIGVLIGALVLVILAGFAMRRSLRVWVTAPLLRIGSDAREVAGGEVAHSIAPTGPPEFQHLAADLEAMRERIVSELAEIGAARSDLAERNRELARSNVELEQFAYVASHDLQEPLRKVTSFVQLLQQRYEGELDDRADQFIEFAVDGAKRMQVLINDLLAFSRVGRTTERFEELDLASTIAVAVSNLEPAIAETGAQIEVGPLPTVNGDPGLLAALWQNLIGNSLKFRSPERPKITIEATGGPGQWTFSVTDNGIGIEPRFANKVFVIFQRLHSRESYDGTGIGLALSKKIVEFHGGEIWLELDHRPGTRLCFTLPSIAKEIPS